MIKLQGPSRIINYDETLCVERIGKVIYVDGKPVQSEIIRFDLHGNVQPLNGRDLLLVPEGDRYKEQYWIWMNNTAKPLEINDQVIRNSQDAFHRPITSYYQVQEAQQWGSYTRARIMRIDVGPKASP